MAKSYRPWVEEEDAILTESVRDGLGTREIADLLKRPYKSVEWRIGKLRVQRYTRQPVGVTLTREVSQRHGATVLAPISTSPEPESDFLARVLRNTSQSVTQAKEERYARLQIASDKPVALSLSSDWHLTADGPTHVTGLLEHAEAIRDTPNAYALAVGDMTDNPIKHKPQDVGDVSDDLRLLDIVIGRFGGKLLGMTSGNHDDWTKAMVGVDSLKTMAERHQLHYAPDELIWLVEIVDPKDPLNITARWTIATRHQFRRHSNLNHTHACWRWMEENANNWPHDGKGATLLPDVLAIGHNHVAAVEHRSYERGTVIACRMGSWQYTSPYTRAGGWVLMPPTAPTVVLPHVRDGVNQPHAYERYQDALKAI